MTTPTGGLLANVTASVAEWERKIIGTRTHESLAARRAAGVTLGRPGQLHPAIANRIRAERTSGSTLQAVADRLNAEGTTHRAGEAWNPTLVRKVALQADRHDWYTRHQWLPRVDDWLVQPCPSGFAQGLVVPDQQVVVLGTSCDPPWLMALATLILGIFGVLFAGVAALGVLSRLWLVPDLRMHATPGIRYEPTPLGDGTLCYVRLALVNVGRAAAEGWGVVTVPLPENGVGSVTRNGVTDVDSGVRTSAKTVSAQCPTVKLRLRGRGRWDLSALLPKGALTS